jgi:osmotically-inducible protein OsmY
MEHIANRPDASLQRAVEEVLKTALGKEAPHVGVSADHGTITLTGEVLTEAKRTAAHAATLAQWGVHAIADDMTVRPPRLAGSSDTDIARAAQAVLLRSPEVPTDSVVVEVTDHVITLTGHAASDSERLAAERAVSYLPGVARIDNRVIVRTGSDR